MNNLRSLITAADVLDSKGLTKEADFLDQFVKSAAERTRAVQDFIDALHIGFNNAAKSKLFPHIKSALPEIFEIINTMAENRTFVGPMSTPETLQKILLPDSIILLVEAILARQDDIKNIEYQIGQEKDPMVLSGLHREYENLKKELGKKFDEVYKLRTNDVDKYRAFVEKYNELKSRKHK